MDKKVPWKRDHNAQLTASVIYDRSSQQHLLLTTSHELEWEADPTVSSRFWSLQAGSQGKQTPPHLPKGVGCLITKLLITLWKAGTRALRHTHIHTLLRLQTNNDCQHQPCPSQHYHPETRMETGRKTVGDGQRSTWTEWILLGALTKPVLDIPFTCIFLYHCIDRFSLVSRLQFSCFF